MVMETLPQGTVLNGHYRIERVLGTGGFGHVYLAIDLRTNQQYAIKEYLVSGASGKAQLEHEARVISQLHHPNLPAFQDAFDERGRYYIVLGYIEGSDLTDLIRVVRQRNEVIPLARILNWIISICDAVTFLHNQIPPIIHRDIKPDNIRITSDGMAILVDLGNAKATADGARTLFFIRHQGTPGYAPLEQYPGGSGTDSRSDVYALGGTLYFALTTHEPPNVSTRNQSMQQNLPDLPSLQEQLAHNPPESSLASGVARQFRLGVTKPAKPVPRHLRHLAQLGTLPPELLERLNMIIKKAMAMKPKERYQSVSEMSYELKQVSLSLPLSTQVSSTNATRTVDPHSTQPDLPQLFESMQSAQANKDRTSQDSSPSVPSQQPQPSVTSVSLTRCPQCNAEIRSQATFCPQCGFSLTNKAQNNLSAASSSQTPASIIQNPTKPSHENRRVLPGSSDETRITAIPKIPESYFHSTGDSQQGSSVSPVTLPSNPEQNMMQTQLKPSAQNTVFSPAPSQVPPKSFIKTSVPTLAQVTPSVQAPTAVPTTKPANNVASTETQKILLYMAIVFIIVLLIVMFIVLKSSVQHSSNNTSHQHYATGSQVCNYEQNISLCTTSTTPHPHTGLWTRRTGVPSTISVSERVVRPRIGHAPGDLWDWFA
ncbi:MAG TPA: serine/threonine-protein kinase [Ktedonobacteraceae bacterium]|nr:serine/threonine-protein kinase [Ktedonobacteraceae bacterium]